MTPGDDPRYVRVMCPTCRAVLHPRVEKAGRRVRCPDCYSAVLVPRPAKAPAAPKVREVGEYGVRGALAPARAEADGAVFFPLLCPKCQARLHPRRSHVGRRARCPDCDTVFVVPPPPRAEQKRPPPAPGKYGVGQEAKRIEPEFHYLTLERLNEPEPEPLAPPDERWFAAGVFTFPWWPGAWSRWLALAMLLVPALFLVGVVAMMAGGGVNRGMTAVPYLMAPLAWLWVWALSYGAACFVAIIQDTGSGNDEVASWPEGDWRERLGVMLYVGLHLTLALAAASAFAWPIGVFFGRVWMGLAVALAANFVFPLFLLGSMEAGSLYTPYSPVIFGSLRKLPGSWLIVYFESLVLYAIAAASLGVGLFWAPVAVFLASPVLATVVFIAGRLYGRLAWRIGQAETKRKRRKKKIKRPAPDAMPLAPGEREA